jgi:hypothetical protein
VMGNGAGGDEARRGPDGATRSEKLFTKLRLVHEEREKRHPQCRCEPLLSNQSNKVGPTPTFKAFRPRRTCTVLPARLGSLGVYITVER